MKIQKYQWGNPVEEWGSQWKERLQPSGGSKVIQKWNATGKKPKPESSTEKARKQAQPQRTWRSDVADIFHNIGEGVLALSPYTAVPYYGAKVGQDFLNGNVGVHTALNASVPLFSGIGQLPNKTQIYKTILDGLWFLKNPRAVKVYHVNRLGEYFPLQQARTGSPSNIGLHVTPKKEIAQSFNEKAPVMEAYIPKHNMETIDIWANDYNLFSNDYRMLRTNGLFSWDNPKRNGTNIVHYSITPNDIKRFNLIKKYGGNPSISDNGYYLYLDNDVTIPLLKETWPNMPVKVRLLMDEIIKEGRSQNLILGETFESKAQRLNLQAAKIASDNGKKVIKYINANPFEGGGGVSYIITDPKVFYNPLNYNIPSIILNTSKYIKFPLIYESNKEN